MFSKARKKLQKTFSGTPFQQAYAKQIKTEANIHTIDKAFKEKEKFAKQVKDNKWENEYIDLIRKKLYYPTTEIRAGPMYGDRLRKYYDRLIPQLESKVRDRKAGRSWATGGKSKKKSKKKSTSRSKKKSTSRSKKKRTSRSKKKRNSRSKKKRKK